ncbi:nucleotidyltransferase family protein [Streptomyces xanthii]|uniref:Nucleotidyltransferase family protein n=1 Tax=Streptomyces xanthii TaxID=2768069 RepID=A0A7H1BK63_9ACTN|nr:nucleotidyltransferase family protein [Streptomyces xanthii]QNS09118.1 nucleotidyltransferase family protein [Streptomyces xanthii]
MRCPAGSATADVTHLVCGRGEPPTVRQAVILAGGRGSRLLPLTRERPKAMVEVHGVPILRHQLDWLAACGVEHVVVSAGHQAQVIVSYLDSCPSSPRAAAVVEDRPLGRGGGLRRAACTLPYPGEPWFALYGDIWTSFCLCAMSAHHLRSGVAATVALAGPGQPGSSVACDDLGRVTAFAPAAPGSRRVNAGVYLFAWRVVAMLPEEGDHADSTLPRLVRARQLAGYTIDVPWQAVNTPADVIRLERELAARRTSSRTETAPPA